MGAGRRAALSLRRRNIRPILLALAAAARLTDVTSKPGLEAKTLSLKESIARPLDARIGR
jgi:hypothetical protein